MSSCVNCLYMVNPPSYLVHRQCNVILIKTCLLVDSRINGRNSVVSSVGEHGALNGGIINFYHEGSRNSSALLNSHSGVSIFILQLIKHTIHYIKQLIALS